MLNYQLASLVSKVDNVCAIDAFQSVSNYFLMCKKVRPLLPSLSAPL